MPVTMQKPPATDVKPAPAPVNMQFSHFGVLNDGQQSRTSLFTSITVNIIIAFGSHHHRRCREEDNG